MARLGQVVVLVLAWPILALRLLPGPLRRSRAAVTTPPALDLPFLWVVATSTIAAGALLAGALFLVLQPPRGAVLLVVGLSARAAQCRAIDRWVASLA